MMPYLQSPQVGSVPPARLVLTRLTGLRGIVGLLFLACGLALWIFAAVITLQAVVPANQALTASGCRSESGDESTADGSVTVLAAVPNLVRPVVEPVYMSTVGGQAQDQATLKPGEVIQVCRLTSDVPGGFDGSYVTTTLASVRVDGTQVSTMANPRRFPGTRVAAPLALGVVAFIAGMLALLPRRRRIPRDTESAE